MYIFVSNWVFQKGKWNYYVETYMARCLCFYGKRHWIFLQISMNAQAVLLTVTQKQSVAIQMVHSLALETKDTHSQFLCKVCTFSFKSLHPKTHHVFLFAMRCLNSRVKLPQQTICLTTYPIFVPISCCAHTTCLNKLWCILRCWRMPGWDSQLRLKRCV